MSDRIEQPGKALLVRHGELAFKKVRGDLTADEEKELKLIRAAFDYADEQLRVGYERGRVERERDQWQRAAQAAEQGRRRVEAERNRLREQVESLEEVANLRADRHG